MAAKFEKVLVPPLGDFDGFDPKIPYQMVPVRDQRIMSVVTDKDECTIVVDPPNIAKMAQFVFTRPLIDVPREFRASVTPNNTITFQIQGLQKGNTTFFLVDGNGKATTQLLVSVKEKITRTFSLCRVSDRRHLCPFLPEQLPPIARAMKKTFIQQANIDLIQVGAIFEVICTENLGNPLILENPVNRNAIISNTPREARVAIFQLYFVWDLFSNRAGQIVGQNFGFDCYVEQGNNPFENAITAAHEIGHGLGLNHTGAKSLMAGDGNSRSSKLQQFEIDTINDTDDAP